MKQTTCTTCDSLRKIGEVYKNRLQEKEKVVLEKDEIINQCAGLVRFLEETQKAKIKCLLCNETGTMQTETGYRNCFCAAGIVEKTD